MFLLNNHTPIFASFNQYDFSNFIFIGLAYQGKDIVFRFPHFSDMLAHISDELQNKTKQYKMNPSNSCHVASCEL
jgi:hypothetical protein